MEKNTAPRARFVAAILLFVAVIAGDLVLSRDYLTQGLYAIPAFLIFELVMLFLLSVLQPPRAGQQQKAAARLWLFPSLVRCNSHLFCRL